VSKPTLRGAHIAEPPRTRKWRDPEHPKLGGYQISPKTLTQLPPSTFSAAWAEYPRFSSASAITKARSGRFNPST